MSVQEIENSEQDIITREWHRMPSALAKLREAQLMRPWSGEYQPKHGGDRPYRQYCEALLQDLLQGNYRLIRRPDVSSGKNGTEKVVEWLVNAENECNAGDPPQKTFRRSEHVLKWLEYQDTTWFFKTDDGIGYLLFTLADNSLIFGYDFDACRNTARLPTQSPEWYRKPPKDNPHYNQRLAFGVIEREPGVFVGLEYFSVHGYGDENKKNGYAGSYLPDLGWRPAPDSASQLPAKSGRTSKKKLTKEEQEWGPPTFFLGAFIAPPPWKQLYEEEAYTNSGFGEPIEPCVWRLND